MSRRWKTVAGKENNPIVVPGSSGGLEAADRPGARWGGRPALLWSGSGSQGASSVSACHTHTHTHTRTHTHESTRYHTILCSTERNVNQCVLNRVRVTVRVRVSEG